MAARARRDDVVGAKSDRTAPQVVYGPEQDRPGAGEARECAHLDDSRHRPVGGRLERAGRLGLVLVQTRGTANGRTEARIPGG